MYRAVNSPGSESEMGLARWTERGTANVGVGGGVTARSRLGWAKEPTTIVVGSLAGQASVGRITLVRKSW